MTLKINLQRTLACLGLISIFLITMSCDSVKVKSHFEESPLKSITTVSSIFFFTCILIVIAHRLSGLGKGFYIKLLILSIIGCPLHFFTLIFFAKASELLLRSLGPFHLLSYLIAVLLILFTLYALVNHIKFRLFLVRVSLFFWSTSFWINTLGVFIMTLLMFSTDSNDYSLFNNGYTILTTTLGIQFFVLIFARMALQHYRNKLGTENVPRSEFELF